MSEEPKELTLFEKIANHTIPSDMVYEDDLCCAFKDINPCAPVHIIVVPKVCDGLTQLRYMREDQEQLVGHLMRVVGIVAMQQHLEPGYRVVINDGPDAQQTVLHLHIHVIGGKKCGWPPV
ncbi:uncharacterized protein [Blastocystis hominis]|uniref:HIT domain-containing protein n=1 Tax=Blastocystis hominis TaxID=12968 RepID=D8M8K7_BLAHO|nr:uncharacterized protein [Blastocystis hominis]CBK24396.2 unnamed protein product [Blastocystis hominis]|eukprot:XP_012898444.1 uncharacterized protein [Blastocystis hominis]